MFRNVALSWLLVAIALAVCYWPVIVELVAQWSQYDAYSHGFLVPWVSLYVAWMQRDKLGRLGAPRPHLGGALVLACSTAMLMGGRIIDVGTLRELSIVLSVAGLVLLLMGPRTLRVLWLPVAYLLFMIPALEIATEPLRYPLQLFTARAGSWLMGVLGVPVFRQDTFLQLPYVTLQVAKVCSGISHLLAVTAVGVALAYLSLQDNLKRILLVVAAIVVAIGANAVRVAIIGLLAYHGFSGGIHGPWHILQGLFVASVAYLALLIGVLWMRRGPTPVVHREPPARTRSPLPPALASRSARRELPVLPLAVAAATYLILVGSARPEAWFVREPAFYSLGAVPLDLGPWKGRETALPSELRDSTLPQPGELSRTYTRTTGEAVQLYIGAFGHQDRKSGTVSYWTDQFDPEADRATLRVGQGESVGVNSIAVHRSRQEIGVLYWYSLGGRLLADRMTAKLYGLWCRVMYRPTPLVFAIVYNRSERSRAGAQPDAAAMFSQEALPPLLGAIVALQEGR